MFANILAKPLSEVINSNLAPNMSFFCGKVTTHFSVDNKADKKCRIFWPLSLLNCFSKIYENILKGRLFSTIEPFLPTCISAYRKHYKAQHVLLRLLEEWREKLMITFLQVMFSWTCLRLLTAFCRIFYLRNLQHVVSTWIFYATFFHISPPPPSPPQKKSMNKQYHNCFW